MGKRFASANSSTHSKRHSPQKGSFHGIGIPRRRHLSVRVADFPHCRQALLGEDFSITNAFVVIVTMVGLDIGLSLLKQRWPFFDKLLEGAPWSSSKTGTRFGSA
ncbi:hypothetical protein RG903_09585 [Thermithiobacillus tepidarius DSM 3134]